MNNQPITLPPALASLASQDRWVCWKWITGKNGKLTKPPYQGHDPSRHARSTEPQTWCDLQTCLLAYDQQQVDGVGYALKDSDVVTRKPANSTRGRMPSFSTQTLTAK
jgi:primase-polymerase (primpol)-like protein